MNLRAIAAEVLAPVMAQRQSLSSSLPPGLQQVSARDRALLQQLCYGTLRWQPRLEKLAGKLLHKPFKSKDRDLHALLLVGLYQLSALRIPEHAALSETVAATQSLGKGWAKGVLNGALRNYLRQRVALEQRLNGDPEFRFAHPHWLIDQLRQAWPEQWQALLEQNNQQPPFCLRVNRRLHTPDSYQTELDAAGQAARPGLLSPDSLYLEVACDVDQLPGFEQGWVSVQDEAAQLAADLLDLRPGQQVLDACAAPGGKSCHMLEREAALAGLDALDISPERLERVRESLTRLNLACDLLEGDAADRAWWPGVPYDRILADVPCSATGVIRRHPDIKCLRQPADIPALAALQARILDNLWQLLKPGGRLVYATCSVLPAENSDQVAAFLDRQSDARLLPIEADWGLDTGAGRQLLPQHQGHDGFFYAILEKAES